MRITYVLLKRNIENYKCILDRNFKEKKYVNIVNNISNTFNYKLFLLLKHIYF